MMSMPPAANRCLDRRVCRQRMVPHRHAGIISRPAWEHCCHLVFSDGSAVLLASAHGPADGTRITTGQNDGHEQRPCNKRKTSRTHVLMNGTNVEAAQFLITDLHYARPLSMILTSGPREILAMNPAAACCRHRRVITR